MSCCTDLSLHRCDEIFGRVLCVPFPLLKNYHVDSDFDVVLKNTVF